nr:sulfatase [Candidatus Sigynarchaeota archaeon]
MALSKRYNILLITIDALRYDHCTFNGYQRNTTPGLARVAPKGVIFDNVWSTGPCTPPSFSAMFTGTFPFDKGGYSPIPQVKQTIAEYLKQNGYQTAGYTSNPLTSHYYNYHRGFSRFFDSLSSSGNNPFKRKFLGGASKSGSRWNAILNRLQNLNFSKVLQTTLKNLLYKVFFGRQVIYYVRARWITRRAIKWLKYHAVRNAISENESDGNVKLKKEEKQRPFFLWVHYMDTHDPFIPKWKHLKAIGSRISRREHEHNTTYPEYTDILKEHDKRQKLVDLYDAEAYAVDERIMFLRRYCKHNDLYGNTVFIVTADHGEEFNEHGDYGHRAHLYNQLLHVPLVIFGGPVENREIPGLDPGTRSVVLCSLAQLAPTIAKITGLESPSSFDVSPILFNARDASEHDILRRHIISCTYHKGIIARFSSVGDTGVKKMISIQDEHYKFIFDEETNIVELYDLKADPDEKENVSPVYPEIARSLSELAGKYLAGQGYLLETSLTGKIASEKQKIISALKHVKMKI